MRTTIDIPDRLLEEAIRLSRARTKTMVIVLGLQELINRHRLNQLRGLRGQIQLATDVERSRRRKNG